MIARQPRTTLDNDSCTRSSAACWFPVRRYAVRTSATDRAATNSWKPGYRSLGPGISTSHPFHARRVLLGRYVLPLGSVRVVTDDASSLSSGPDRPMRWGIISTGGIAATMARDLGDVDDAVRFAVASRTADRAEAFAEAHGFERA